MVDKIRENRVRRQVARRGFRLHKVRRFDPHAWDYGTYTVDGARGRARRFADIDELEAWLEATP